MSEPCWRCGERAAVGSFGRGCPNSSASAFFACEDGKEGGGGKGLERREEAVSEMEGRDEALHIYIPPHLYDGVEIWAGSSLPSLPPSLLPPILPLFPHLVVSHGLDASLKGLGLTPLLLRQQPVQAPDEVAREGRRERLEGGRISK